MRGLSPYPAAWTELCAGEAAPVMLKLFETRKLFQTHDLQPGTVVSDGKTFFHIASLQLAGKKRMQVEDFLRGYRLAEHMQVR